MWAESQLGGNYCQRPFLGALSKRQLGVFQVGGNRRVATIQESVKWQLLSKALLGTLSKRQLGVFQVRRNPSPNRKTKISTDISVNPCILMHGRCVIELGERRFVTPRAFTVEKNSRRWNSQGGGTRRRWNSQGHGTLRRRKSLKSGTPRGWNCCSCGNL